MAVVCLVDYPVTYIARGIGTLGERCSKVNYKKS